MKYATFIFVVCVLPTLSFTACQRQPPPSYYYFQNTGLMIPRFDDFAQDTQPDEELHSELLLKLIHKQTDPGALRISIWRESANTQPTILENYLTRNLQIMANLESQHQLHILSVEQHKTTLDKHTCYRVKHEYTTGTAPHQTSITQISLFFLLQQRGTTITAVGRTELLHPLAQRLEDFFSAIKITKD